MRMRRFFAFLLWLLLCGAARAEAPRVEAGFPETHKGMNFSSWLANAVRQPMYERDFLQVKNAGFDNIRLPVNPEEFGYKFEPGTRGLAAADFTPVDKAIDLAVKTGLPLVLDLHPGGDFMKDLENQAPWSEPAFIDLWTGLAKRYKKYPATVLAFGLLNEPQYYNAEDRYMKLAAKAVAAIRAVDPARTIMVDPPEGASLDALEKMKPLDAGNIVYDFHFYEPYIVTHQGIHMGFEKEMTKSFHNVPYPASLVDKDAAYYAPAAPNPALAAKELREYVDAGWDAAHIAERIGQAKAWSDENKAPVICGEFGVLRYHIDPASRYRWISDARTAMEADRIGWQLWDYTDAFGIVTLHGATSQDPVDLSERLADPEKGSRTLEPAAIAALGLH